MQQQTFRQVAEIICFANQNTKSQNNNIVCVLSLLIRVITKQQKNDREQNAHCCLEKKSHELNVLKEYETRTHMAALLAGI